MPICGHSFHHLALACQGLILMPSCGYSSHRAGAVSPGEEPGYHHIRARLHQDCCLAPGLRFRPHWLHCRANPVRRHQPVGASACQLFVQGSPRSQAPACRGICRLSSCRRTWVCSLCISCVSFQLVRCPWRRTVSTVRCPWRRTLLHLVRCPWRRTVWFVVLGAGL